MGGKAYRQDTRIYKIFKGPVEAKKVYFKNTEVFSSSHDVAYHADVNNIIMKEIEDETDVISQAPIVTKEGWIFVGWRLDTEPDPDVLVEYIATDDDIHVYAVFEQSMYVEIVGGEETLYQTDIRYYNNGNYRYPIITLASATLDGWSLVGYRLDTNPDPTVPYYGGQSYTFTQNTTLYTVFKQTVTLSVLIKGTTYTYPRTRYVNNNNYDNPVVYVPDPEIEDADFLGYSSDESSTEVTIETLSDGYTLIEDVHFYAVWHYHDAVLMTNPSGVNFETGDIWAPSDHPPIYIGPLAPAFNGIKYVAVTVDARADAGCGGSWIQNGAQVGVFDTRIVFHSVGEVQGEFQEGPCAYGARASVRCEGVPLTNPYTLYANVTGQRQGNSWIRVYSVTGNGRTLVY